MNVAVIGGGGREHALARKLAQSDRIETVYAIPGNDGMRDVAEVVPEIGETDFEKIAALCTSKQVAWVVVGPEAPLSEGIADYLEGRGIKVFGPRKEEAKIESSKAFTKDIMEKYDIPTARYKAFTDYDAAYSYIESVGAPIVLKKDGLAAGKGVIVATDMDEALAGLDALMADSDAPIVIEEFLEGEEFSLMVLVNGDYTHSFEIIAQDHKRAFDNDEGPNTGGMGAYAPVRHIPESVRQEAVDQIVGPMARAMVSEGLDYFGVLYLGAIVTDKGVKTIEFNARFGDPEAQILLSLMEDDLVDVLEKVDRKEAFTLTFSPRYQVGVMLASAGYPGSYDKGHTIDFEAVREKSFVSGLKQENEGWVTAGGRVLLVTGEGETIESAIDSAYHNVDQVKFNEGEVFIRRDIGRHALK
ncbi:phosphoribosylamine--glycine ligase [Salinicoccus sp. ID82-1]|uniref:Phosphoribosylamine--glycine ligase n=1 Tax=Salinicoccus cyprini TaxID=2493691 RepID=A0A558B024_9STAP|nr:MULTISPECIES: phosphoribosylamine--glycine ligase [Salinicoccus]MCG1008566.1 phosphoribosylamine--glycine ligase [Salinicoccus sp. ID82-1]TVT29860.1 phosphoribosylamine--glycine ligase [Salinicoccus cyprini]